MTRPKTATHFVSYPKSGRTWLRLMVAKYLGQLTNSGSTLEDLGLLTAAAGIAPINLSHAGASLPQSRLLDMAELTQAYAGEHVLFLVRNFEDTLVSSYFQARYRKNLFDGSLSDFIRAPRFGAARLRQFLDRWAEALLQTDSFCLICYEEMHQDPQFCLSKALVFFGIAEPQSSLLQSAVDFCAFDNLQQMEREDVFSGTPFRARDTSKIETYKFRQGQIGGYVDHMSEDDLAFLRDFLADNRNDLLRSALIEQL